MAAEDRVKDADNLFGKFLRSRRERTTPAQVALADGRRRRTPGLRREEVAQLAGISTEWYIKLEQGRAAMPSPATVEALSRALLLDGAERAHLRALAGETAPKSDAAVEVPATLRRLVESLPEPAYVLGARWDMLAWNRAAAALFDELVRPEGERNVLRFTLTTTAGRRLFGSGWAAEARRMTAMFRATYDLHATDPVFMRLREELQTGCPEFGTWWRSHAIATPESSSKLLYFPYGGAVRYDYTTLQSNDDPRLKLVSYATSISTDPTD